jgi:hypothetical protein
MMPMQRSVKQKNVTQPFTPLLPSGYREAMTVSSPREEAAMPVTLTRREEAGTAIHPPPMYR